MDAPCIVKKDIILQELRNLLLFALREPAHITHAKILGKG